MIYIKNFMRGFHLNLADFWFVVGVIFTVLILNITAHCKLYPVQVVSIYDGDTLRLKFDNDFEFDARLHGIDAPELAQKFGEFCLKALEQKTSDGGLRAYFIAEDSYNRKLIKLVRADYSEINYELIEAGCAWLYSPTRSERTKYREAFKIAWTSQIGLFGDPPFCEPRKWRKGTCTEEQ